MKREISDSDVCAYLETLLWSETLHESVTIEGAPPAHLLPATVYGLLMAEGV